MDKALSEYQISIITLTQAGNGPKGVTKALIKQDHHTLKHIVEHHLVHREDARRSLTILTDEEKQARHRSGFPQASYLFLRQMCFLTLAAHASLCLVSLEDCDTWNTIDTLVERDYRGITVEMVIECVWGLLFRCHLDRTFYNGMQRAGKQDEVSDRMVRTIYMGLSRRLFHVPNNKTSEEK